MNILVLNPILFTIEKNATFKKAGTIKDTMIYGMCMALNRLPCVDKVTLAAAKEYEPVRQESYDFDVRFFKSDCTKICQPSVLPYSVELKKFLKRNAGNYDIVISSETFNFYTLYAARICPEKTIIWQELTRHQNKFKQLPSKIWHNVVARLFMRKIRCVVPRSAIAYEFIKKYMRQTTPIVVDHGIDIGKFIPNKDKSRQIISSSQLIYRKNVDGIIRIFEKLHHEKGYDDIKLIIAGKGEEEQNLKNLVSALGLESSVEFVGFLPQKELNRYIRESLCFLVNTRKDLNMVSIPESIVSGTPVLTNMQNASATYISQNRLGISKDNWGVEELKEMIDNNSLYVDNCIKYRDKLTSDYSAAKLVEIYNNPVG